jgi:hypothetical protein
MGMIKTENELLRLIWKEMGLKGTSVDIKKRIVVAKEIHNAVEFGMKNQPSERYEEVFNAVARLFLSRIDDTKNDDLAKETRNFTLKDSEFPQRM